MDLLKQYEFDALPYIDREYDNPLVQEAVNQLVAAEMRAIKPGNYVAHLPYPKVKFVNSPQFQAEISRIKNGNHLLNLDLSKYDVEKPTGILEKDIQGWRKAITSLKCTYEHQNNRLMNLELAEAHSPSIYLHHNQALESMENIMSQKTSTLKRKIDEVNLSRKIDQEKVQGELTKLLSQRDQALNKSWQIKARCDEMENIIKNSKGIEE